MPWNTMAKLLPIYHSELWRFRDDYGALLFWKPLGVFLFFFPKYASICGGLCLEIPLVQVSSEYWNHFTKLFPFPKIKCTLHLLFDANKGGTRNSKVQFITVELLIRTAWRLEVTMAYSLTYGQVWTKSQLIPNGSVKHVVSATGHSYETVRISKWLLCHLQRGKSHKSLAK